MRIGHLIEQLVCTLGIVLGFCPLSGCNCGRQSPTLFPAQPTSLEVGRFNQPPIIDGKLDEPGWNKAQGMAEFVDPGDGHVVSGSPVKARAKLGWDESALYVAITVDDAQPASPFARDDVDPHLWEQSSAIEMMLQPGDFSDNRDYYEIQVDTHEAVWDTFFDDYNTPVGQDQQTKVMTFGHQDWQSHIERKVTLISGKSYTLEMAIPWSAFDRGRARTLVPPKSGQVWRANFYSFRDGQNQSLAWSPLRGEGNFHKTARFGKLVYRK